MTEPDTLYWEDFKVGQTLRFGGKHVTREEIIAFAREFDPQPFHLDEAAARDTLLGGLAASGWHSCAMLMRMIWDGYLHRTASMGGPGFDEVRWLRPVRPGDTLSGRSTVLEARASSSRPNLGILKMHTEVSNQRGEVVLTLLGAQFVARRRQGAAAKGATV